MANIWIPDWHRISNFSFDATRGDVIVLTLNIPTNLLVISFQGGGEIPQKEQDAIHPTQCQFVEATECGWCTTANPVIRESMAMDSENISQVIQTLAAVLSSQICWMLELAHNAELGS